MWIRSVYSDALTGKSVPNDSSHAADGRSRYVRFSFPVVVPGNVLHHVGEFVSKLECAVFIETEQRTWRSHRAVSR